MENITVGYSTIEILGIPIVGPDGGYIRHKYLVYTDSDGNKLGLRAGPDSEWRLVPVVAPYDENFVDYDEFGTHPVEAITIGDNVIDGFVDFGDTIAGGLGNDIVRGSRGSDTYLYASATGPTTSTTTAAAPTWTASSSLASTRTMSPSPRSSSDLDDVTLSFGGGGSVFLKEHFYSNSYGIEYVDFADGTSWNRSAILDAVLI